MVIICDVYLPIMYSVCVCVCVYVCVCLCLQTSNITPKNKFRLPVNSFIRIIVTPLGKFRRVWEDNFRMDLRKVGWEGVNWMHLT
jgi:hypothetical protein